MLLGLCSHAWGSKRLSGPLSGWRGHLFSKAFKCPRCVAVGAFVSLGSMWSLRWHRLKGDSAEGEEMGGRFPWGACVAVRCTHTCCWASRTLGPCHGLRPRGVQACSWPSPPSASSSGAAGIEPAGMHGTLVYSVFSGCGKCTPSDPLPRGIPAPGTSLPPQYPLAHTAGLSSPSPSRQYRGHGCAH